jgi:hypothetical protein
VAMPDGPVIFYIHALAQIIFSTSDHAFRRFDFLLQLSCSASIGILLAPRSPLSPVATALQRAAWAALAVGVWFASYLAFPWQNITQRDAIYDSFGYLSVVLAYVSSAGEATLRAPRRCARALFVAGFLAVAVIFAKQTGLIFLACAIWPTLIREGRRNPDAGFRPVTAVLAGAAAGCAIFFILLGITAGAAHGENLCDRSRRRTSLGLLGLVQRRPRLFGQHAYGANRGPVRKQRRAVRRRYVLRRGRRGRRPVHGRLRCGFQLVLVPLRERHRLRARPVRPDLRERLPVRRTGQLCGLYGNPSACLSE